MRRQRNSVWCGIPILCDIFVKKGISVGGDIFVRVDGDDSRWANVSVDLVGQKAFSKAGDDDVV